MAPKKNKGQKMDLGSFLADTTTGNWADEMDDIPSAPIAKDPDAPRRGDPGYFDSLPNRGAGGENRFQSSREEIPLPTRAPFNAYVGNLAFDAVEEDVEVFFSGVATKSIKVIRDHEGKPKGFGYVEFDTLDGLKEALARSGENFGGRNVRISVAEPPKEGGRGGYSDEPSAADTATQWRRAGPLPARSSPAQGRGFARDSPSGGFGGGSDAGQDVDWSAARGTKFTPRPEGAFGGSQGGFQRGPMREQREPPAGLASLDDVPSDWRGSRPARAPPAFEQRDSFQQRDSFRANGAPGRQFVERDVGLTGEAAQEESWSRGSKFQASQPRPAAGRRESNTRPDVEEKSDWRSGKKSLEATPSGSAEPSPARKHLSLLPRTNPTSPTTEDSPASKASPFGAARAVDTSAREKEAMERAQKREEERRAAIDAAKQKRIAEAKEREGKAQESASGLGITTEPKRVHPSRQQANGAAAAPSARPAPLKRDSASKPASAWRRDSTEAPSKTAKAPATQEVDADGFVIATGSSATRKAAAREQKQAQQQQDQREANKPKFSFAAAGEGFVEGDVEQVREGVEGVVLAEEV